MAKRYTIDDFAAGHSGESFLCTPPVEENDSGASAPPMLTMKGKYGLKALLHLATVTDGSLTLSEEIARTNGISKKFLDAILGELRNAGFVHARKGRGGGYALSRSANDIRVGHVLRVLDGPLAPIPCASKTAYRRCDDCRDEQACSVRLVMLEVRNAISAILDRKTLSELAAMPSLVDAGETHLALEHV